MADHRAEQIAVELEVILSNLSITGENVFRGRVHSLDDNQIPALAFFIESEQPLEVYNNNLQDRLLEFMIEGYVKTTDADSIDSQLNQIRKDVTIAINADRTLGLAFVVDTMEGEARYQLEGEADQNIGSVTMQWSVHYRRSITDPSA